MSCISNQRNKARLASINEYITLYEKLHPISPVISRISYHLIPNNKQPINQTMIPDFVLFVEPLSLMNFELFFVEVKTRGKTSNSNSESDLIKLGKEMQIAINKLVFQRVKNPQVVGILIQGEIGALTSLNRCQRYSLQDGSVLQRSIPNDRSKPVQNRTDIYR